MSDFAMKREKTLLKYIDKPKKCEYTIKELYIIYFVTMISF